MSSRTVSAAELLAHSTSNSCWIAIRDKVYDVTSFLQDHPGGDAVLLEHSGRDATDSFDDIGHTDDAQEMLGKYVVGEYEVFKAWIG
jgi:cytochrome b5